MTTKKQVRIGDTCTQAVDVVQPIYVNKWGNTVLSLSEQDRGVSTPTLTQLRSIITQRGHLLMWYTGGDSLHNTVRES